MTPLEFMLLYRRIVVPVGVVEDAQAMVCRVSTLQVQLRTYFMMSWTAGTETHQDYNYSIQQASGSGADTLNTWRRQNLEAIKSAGMGKGRPGDYALSMEWAVRSGLISNPTQQNLQTYCDERLGIDCSGFVTNYLCHIGKRPFSHQTLRNSNAASYYDEAKAINDPLDVRQGDLLVWMDGNHIKRSPGHIAVVESYTPQSAPGGNMRVVEATGAAAANPKLLDSMYTVESIHPEGRGARVMVLQVRRHGQSGSRVAVIRY